MNYLNMWLLLLGSPSIIVLLVFVGIHTWENARTSNQDWSAGRPALDAVSSRQGLDTTASSDRGR